LARTRLIYDFETLGAALAGINERRIIARPRLGATDIDVFFGDDCGKAVENLLVL
jgi:hypothetical protein